MTYDEAILSEIRRRGKDPSDLDTAEFLEISLMVRSPGGMIQAISEASASFVKTRVFSVPLPIYWERREQCESNSCGKFLMLKGSDPACLSCGCAGAGLENAKWWDASQACPIGKWTKHVKPD